MTVNSVTVNRGKKLPSGILGFPITPFNHQGKIDEQALIANIEFLIREGMSAIFVCCGSGEFQSLSNSEYEAILGIAVSVTADRVPVYTGVGGNIANALELAAISERAGADGYLIMPPYLIHGEQEGLYQYVRTIAESTALNAVIYQRDNAVFTLQTVERLLACPQIAGFKDGYGNMEANIELIQTFGNRLEWFNGMPFAEITMPAYAAIGFQSYSSAISNYVPHISKQFFAALQKGNRDLVADIYQHALLPINHIRKQRKGYAVSLIKAGMEIMGLPAGETVRAPLVPVEPEHYRQLEATLQNVLTKFPVRVATGG
jgi:5-dehydro-4-deoxyglucarate dehydratase